MLINAGALPEGSSLYDASNIILLQHLISALRAHTLFQKNVDYVVKDDEVVIVDEFTGRTMPGRRWSEGLHQALEAKEMSQRKKRKSNLGFYYLSKLLQALQQALRYDGYRRNRGARAS